jgi:pimeloyl-ACP methyl ester carboxylesterase
MDFAEHRIATEDGPMVYARDYAADATHRLPVVCLHGLTRNAADFEAVAPRIATLGRRVIVIDARGRGKSDNDPEPARYRPDTYVGDVMRVLDTLNVPRAVFLGTSMGGIMTMLAAVMAPTRIAAAILNDIGPEVDPRGIARIASYVGKAGPFGSWAEMVAAVKASQGAMFPHGDDAFWRTFAQRVARERDDGGVEFAYDPAIAVAFATPPASPPPSMLPLFEALAKAPVLVIRGATSDILSPEGVATMKRIKPDLQSVEVPDVGHAPTLDEHEAWDALAKFLAQVE